MIVKEKIKLGVQFPTPQQHLNSEKKFNKDLKNQDLYTEYANFLIKNLEEVQPHFFSKGLEYFIGSERKGQNLLELPIEALKKKGWFIKSTLNKDADKVYTASYPAKLLLDTKTKLHIETLTCELLTFLYNDKGITAGCTVIDANVSHAVWFNTAVHFTTLGWTLDLLEEDRRFYGIHLVENTFYDNCIKSIQAIPEDKLFSGYSATVSIESVSKKVWSNALVCLRQRYENINYTIVPGKRLNITISDESSSVEMLNLFSNKDISSKKA